jgi:hypothetical protein
LAAQAPDEQEIFDQVVWEVLESGPWPDERRGRQQIGTMAFAGEASAAQVVSPTATMLLLAAVRPDLRRGWLSVREVTDRIVRFAATWKVPALLQSNLVEHIVAHLPDALARQGYQGTETEDKVDVEDR